MSSWWCQFSAFLSHLLSDSSTLIGVPLVLWSVSFVSCLTSSDWSLGRFLILSVIWLVSLVPCCHLITWLTGFSSHLSFDWPLWCIVLSDWSVWLASHNCLFAQHSICCSLLVEYRLCMLLACWLFYSLDACDYRMLPLLAVAAACLLRISFTAVCLLDVLSFVIFLFLVVFV